MNVHDTPIALNEPFASMVRDPAGLIERERARLAAAPDLEGLTRRLTRDWNEAQQLAFHACLSLIEDLPGGRTVIVDAAGWEEEVERMTPRLLAQVPAILLLDLDVDRAAREAVDRAFSIFHRAVRLNAKPPTP